MSVWDIDRNDVAACVEFYRLYGVTEDEGRVMLQLQDDPAELERIMRDWKIGKHEPP